MSDIKPYHEMQSNPKVMQFVTGEVQTEQEHLIELERLIGFYDKEDNDFWIYAIERKSDLMSLLELYAFVKMIKEMMKLDIDF